MKRTVIALLAAMLLITMCACSSGEDGSTQVKVDLSGTALNLSCEADYLDSVGNHIASYYLQQAVLNESGNVVFAHVFVNRSSYRLTKIVCEFIYYNDSGDIIGHKRLTKDLSTNPIEPDGTYTYYSTNYFDGAFPTSMEANITCADTEYETPVQPKPNLDSDFFDFYTDGRYDGLTAAFLTGCPSSLTVKTSDGETKTVTGREEIISVYEAVKKLHIGDTVAKPEGDSAVYTFILRDGSEYTVAFEGGAAVYYGGNYYSVTGLEELFAIKLTDSSYSREDSNDPSAVPDVVG